MRAFCTMIMPEISIYTKHIFNQSPDDEVIGQVGKEKFFLQLSDYRSSIFHFVARRCDKKPGVFTIRR